MFTGLIECIGKVKALTPVNASASTDPWASSVHLTVEDASDVLGDCKIGDSLAVNGTCLTVLDFDSQKFTVGIAPETLRRTNLGSLNENDEVNLERAMRADARFGGHFVQGHVDRTAEIKSITPDGDSLRMVFSFASTTHHENLPLTSLLIPKGYITIDGISLTLCSVSSSTNEDQVFEFEVMLIKHTQLHVALSKKQVGQAVNIEFDCLTKSIARTLMGSISSIVQHAVSQAIASRVLPSTA
ncbi:hypothetical protein CROQUDRAFT_653193 [Cronartium quercuum f. sp. fusiforme G11]|uniref:Lumazine-binding domain-containing protein n=1 Tax=Cronartium quercuum f. sp. fusiforme G11 TaxID=708437 RepID=A0A9P6TEZ3_9BASI|nr:hypothetical protein CROQUDRAFT_653193 [Cronartium quercuum f. sp. fusiforme G11]